jgi:hypothetical protein
MGLDQYANARKGEPTTDEDGNKYWKNSKELAYWRKHPHLQGFMEHLYAEKGGEGEFNCVDVELTLEDIDDLETAVKGGGLPETGGFFFGDDSSDHYKEEDLEFCANARKALADGQTVIYSSWW